MREYTDEEKQQLRNLQDRKDQIGLQIEQIKCGVFSEEFDEAASRKFAEENIWKFLGEPDGKP